MFDPDHLSLRPPVVADGAAMWRLAGATGVLDVNAPYAYLLWCRDFAATSVVAVSGADLAGFVTGFVRPDAPDTILIWQVAVDAAARGRGLAAAMLDDLVARPIAGGRRPRHLETTITDDNAASQALFAGFARRHHAPHRTEALFGLDVFPDGAAHEPEVLHRIGPLDAPTS